MDWNDAIDLRSRKFTAQLVIQRAMARGWDVASFKTNAAIILLKVPNRDEPILLFSASPPQMSYPASKVAKDKYISSLLLDMAGLPVPRELLYNLNDGLQPEHEQLLADVKKVVLKPLDASHGNGVTVNIKDVEGLKAAVQEAEKFTSRQNLVVQEQLQGVDVRVVCIDYKFVDAIVRLPASVVGDGQQTVRELIITTNQHEDRGENYQTKLNRIPMVQVERYLTADELARVPAEGETVQVVGTANIGTGGVRLNIREHVPDWLKTMAEQATRALQLPVCGVDFMLTEQPKVDHTVEELNPRIIEANECPMLTMYDDLHSPEQYAVIDRYLDYVISD
ncbi:MAG TPA: hypothetical protein VGE30_01345 [Candidatus Saccharimonadales bacterium]